MEWREEAIILGVRRHGETSVVAELMTRERGRHMGLVRGGRSRRLQPVLQPGNQVEATWRARLDEHMGTFVVEPVELRAARLMEDQLALHGVQLLAGHLRLLAEREAHPRLFDALSVILEESEGPATLGMLMLRFEIALLEDLGFGLDLERCALTGESEGLAFVSPRTGRAVTATAGAPWRDKLLALPSVLVGGIWAGDAAELRSGFRLTGHFLSRHLWEPRNLAEPSSRHAFLSDLDRQLGAQMDKPLETKAGSD